MPPKVAQQIKQILAGLGLEGEFTLLIDRAIRQGWSPLEFETALRRSHQFRQKFPGLVNRNGDLMRWAVDAGITNLGQAIATYHRTLGGYRDALRIYGGPKLGHAAIKSLFEGGKSPDEFARELQVMQTVRSNPELRASFNEQLSAFGRKPLDEMGFYKFLKGTHDTALYDIYEAARLRSTTGLNLTPEQAQRVAKGIGQPGKPTDLNELVNQVRTMKADIAPELSRAGITDGDLVLLASGSDPKNLGPQLQALVANRRALGQGQQGLQARKGSGGGVALYEEDRPQSY
jgi:hypothetical protein